MSRLMSLIALIAVIVVIGLLFYKVMVGFFVPVFLAAVLVVGVPATALVHAQTDR